MDVEAALQQLGAAYGISLSLSPRGTCRLIFGGNTFVDFEATGPRATDVTLHGLVGTLPASARESFYQNLLEANLFGRWTDGAVLSVDFEQSEVILHRALDLRGATGPDVQTVVERFALQVKTWTDRLANPNAPQAERLAIDETLVRV